MYKEASDLLKEKHPIQSLSLFLSPPCRLCVCPHYRKPERPNFHQQLSREALAPERKAIHKTYSLLLMRWFMRQENDIIGDLAKDGTLGYLFFLSSEQFYGLICVSSRTSWKELWICLRLSNLVNFLFSLSLSFDTFFPISFFPLF